MIKVPNHFLQNKTRPAIRTSALIGLLILASLNSKAQEHAVERSGDVLMLLLPATAFGSTIIWNDETQPIISFGVGSASTFFVTHGLKRLIDKERPNGGRYSFPSGHTSISFHSAAFLERRFGWKVGIPAYLLAGYVGWTRIYSENHDIWDVLGGAALGTGIAYVFTKPYQVENLSVSPIYGNGISGFSLVYRF